MIEHYGPQALTIIGLVLFEVISSLDNAVINADILSTVNPRARKFFATLGIFFAVFVVRGLLPLVIVYVASPRLSPSSAFLVFFSGDPSARHAIETSAPCLTMGGGSFLILLFLHWLFVEHKTLSLSHEKCLTRLGNTGFGVTASLFVIGLIYVTFESPPLWTASALAIVVFFVVAWLKQRAENAEETLRGSMTNDWMKVALLEVIDFAFSVDGVVGAFAFTAAVPLILLGNGVGAIVVRQLTLGNVNRIKEYPQLKNAAMYAIGVLASLMIASGLGVHVPRWVPPATTLVVVATYLKLVKIFTTKQSASRRS